MQPTTTYMPKIVTQKKIAGYTSRLLEGYNSIMAYDDNILSFRFSAYGTLILFNIMNSYYNNKPITSEEIANSIDYKFGSRNSILNLIKTAEKNKLITRAVSKSDQRQKYIIPTKALIHSHEKMIGFILNLESKS
jgi:DNA-binding MarR family transcriptional regulator